MAKLSIDEIVARDVATHDDLPAVPNFDASRADIASVEYSVHRTKLSTHRTALSTDRTELSGRRTGMSFQRTRMSADRTLMSVIRTSLSLIGFGFTIYQFFQNLQAKNMLSDSSHAARNFGAALVWLGVGMVIVGIVYHVQFMLQLRREREAMREEGLIHARSGFPISFTLLVALALLAIGLAAIVSLSFHIGPFD
jgi:inner membrane protein YidH